MAQGNPTREAYLTPENIEDVGRSYVEAFPPRGDIDLDPRRAALLVIDMQRYFLDPDGHSSLPSAPAIVPGILELVRTFNDAGRPVICTRHVNTAADAGLMDEWWGDVITQEDPSSELIPELAGERELLKHRYDAFHHTDLEDMLLVEGVEQVVVTGVMTHLCCETTARGAFMRDLAVFFAVDGTATYNDEMHTGALRGLAHGFATPVRIDDIIGRMK